MSKDDINCTLSTGFEIWWIMGAITMWILGYDVVSGTGNLANEHLGLLMLIDFVVGLIMPVVALLILKENL